MIQTVSLLAAGVALLYGVLLFFMWHYQERIVFQPPRGVASARVDARQVRYRSSDGVNLFAYLVGDCATDGTLVLAFHGNADLARWLVPWAAKLASDTRACVMIPESRGYDGVDGLPTYEGSALDARAALDYVRDTLGFAPSNVVYFGHSLGTGIAVELAVVQPPRALILESPFTSARDMGRRMRLPGIGVFWKAVSRVHFQTIARVADLDVPVWVAHGDKDIIIPIRMGRDVYAAAKRKGELLIVPGAGHNDVAEVGGRAYWSWIEQAIGTAPPTVTTDVPAGTRSEP